MLNVAVADFLSNGNTDKDKQTDRQGNTKETHTKRGCVPNGNTTLNRDKDK